MNFGGGGVKIHYTEFYYKILIFFLLQDTEFTQKNYGRSVVAYNVKNKCLHNDMHSD